MTTIDFSPTFSWLLGFPPPSVSLGGESSKNGGMTRIGKVGKEVVNGPSAGVDMLEPCTHHCQHSQSAILDLFGPQLLDLLRRTTSPPKRVKPQATWVSNISPGELVVREDGVCVYTPWLENVSPSSPFSPADKNKLNDEESCGVSEVFLCSS